MSNIITRWVEQERCVLTAADVWRQAMNEANRSNPKFAVGVGFPEGSLIEGALQKPDYGFFDVSSGILLVKNERFIILAQSKAPFCTDNYLARLVGEGGYPDKKFSFSGDTYNDYTKVAGVGEGAIKLIGEFDVKRHKAGSVITRRNKPYWQRFDVRFV